MKICAKNDFFIPSDLGLTSNLLP